MQLYTSDYAMSTPDSGYTPFSTAPNDIAVVTELLSQALESDSPPDCHFELFESHLPIKNAHITDGVWVFLSLFNTIDAP